MKKEEKGAAITANADGYRKIYTIRLPAGGKSIPAGSIIDADAINACRHKQQTRSAGAIIDADARQAGERRRFFSEEMIIA